MHLAPLAVGLAKNLLPAQTDSKPPHVALAEAVLQGADHITAIAIALVLRRAARAPLVRGPAALLAPAVARAHVLELTLSR